MIEKSLTCLYLDPEVRSKVKPYIKDWMFNSDVYRAIINSLSKPEFDNIEADDRLITNLALSQLPHNSDISSDIREIYNSKSRNLSPTEIKSAISQFENFIKEKYIARGLERHSSSGLTTALEDIKRACNLSLLYEEPFDLSDANTVNTLFKSEFPSGNLTSIKSSFNLINHCSSYGGYKYGDLVLFVSPPGTGKSTMLIGEGATSLLQGYRVHHLFIGDMSGFDAYTKYVSYISKVSVNDVIRNPLKYLDDKVKTLLSRLKVDVIPAMKYNAEQIVSLCKNLRQTFPSDMIILDYDLNVLKTNSDNMYEDGGLSYGLYKGLATTERLVFIIATQPKLSYYDCEIIPLEAAAESSRKQHVIDYMITLGKKPESQTLGSLYAAKVRRGITGCVMRVKRDYDVCSISEITQKEYDDLAVQEKNLNRQQPNKDTLM